MSLARNGSPLRVSKPRSVKHRPAEPVGTQRRFMHQLECQPGLDVFRGPPRPSPQQVPGPQPEVFRDQQPQAGHVVADLIGQSLSHAAFDAQRIAVDVPYHFLADPRRHGLGLESWPTAVEFFFAGRTRPARVPRCGY